ncbi:hypothetical protein [Dyadobacter sp. 3J3]|uniref:hypothetical protein n=1 Tax=Dyadobacter sp. 3J3 TaxID=2606600 RepID=UPI00135A215B|nr:hypothetical protein [Dyadobacter sp. 3J3]
MKHTILCLVLLLGFSVSLQAQDKLIKRNGTVIEGKVMEVGVREIRYQTNPEPNSAKFVIRKAELERIVFGNGEIFVINERVARGASEIKRPSNSQSGENIILLSPFKALDSGPGLGISYERLLGENQYVGVVVPVSFMFNSEYYYNTYSGSNQKHYTNFYVSPGVKFYPFGQRKVTYAVGPNVMIGFTKKLNSQYIYDNNGGQSTIILTPVKSFRLGLIVNNYLNFQITSRINLGINGGLGVRYFDKQQTSNINYSDGMQITAEFAFNFGFRF